LLVGQLRRKNQFFEFFVDHDQIGLSNAQRLCRAAFRLTKLTLSKGLDDQ
jgi:hypothetical protein